MLRSDSVTDYMGDAYDMGCGPLDPSNREAFWDALRNLVMDAYQREDGVDVDTIGDLTPPTEGEPCIVVVFANTWDDEGVIAFLDESALDDALRADLQACNGQIFDDQSDDSDWDNFAAALRIAAACGSQGSFDAFERVHSGPHSHRWAEVAPSAKANFGTLEHHDIFRDGTLRLELLARPVAACYALMLGGR